MCASNTVLNPNPTSRGGSPAIPFAPQTPLHIAVHTNEPAIVKDLVSRGAQLDLVDRHGNTPIHVACRKGLVKVLDVFSSVAPLRRIRAAAELRNVQGEVDPTYHHACQFES